MRGTKETPRVHPRYFRRLEHGAVGESCTLVVSGLKGLVWLSSLVGPSVPDQVR